MADVRLQNAQMDKVGQFRSECKKFCRCFKRKHGRPPVFAFLGASGSGKSCACNMMVRIFSGNRCIRVQAVGSGHDRTSHFVEMVRIMDGDEIFMILLDFPGLSHHILKEDWFWDALRDGVPEQAFLAPVDIRGETPAECTARLQEVLLESNPQNKPDAIFLFVRPATDDIGSQLVPRSAGSPFERLFSAFGSVYTRSQPILVGQTVEQYQTLVSKAIKTIQSENVCLVATHKTSHRIPSKTISQQCSVGRVLTVENHQCADSVTEESMPETECLYLGVFTDMLANLSSK